MHKHRDPLYVEERNTFSLPTWRIYLRKALNHHSGAYPTHTNTQTDIHTHTQRKREGESTRDRQREEGGKHTHACTPHRHTRTQIQMRVNTQQSGRESKQTSIAPSFSTHSANSKCFCHSCFFILTCFHPKVCICVEWILICLSIPS
jgi:hypothetical protein